MNQSFSDLFNTATGNRPFPWQERLYEEWFSEGKIPSTCNLPTGLGKTSVVAIWLIALAKHPGKLPQRLVYVVNRRTVVDQTTAEVKRLRENLPKLGLPGFETLAISTIRGQFADNREWSADPSRPAVICGTVDMIGSRLLFSGYGVGFKAKPLHAGFLGQDALLVHDEAHLEPAFQELIDAIEREQNRCGDFRPFRVMQLTATSRNDNRQSATATFSLDKRDRDHSIVKQRFEARKQLQLIPAQDDKAVPAAIAKVAAGYADANAAVLVFVRTLDAVATIEKELNKTKRHVVLLTGTMRGKERDELVEQPEFKRFLRGAEPGETVYLVCTSAGEVGIDISADHMVCDLSTFESMAQRLGRVNRYGKGDARIDVVVPSSFDEKDKLAPARQKTRALLEMLPQLPERHEEPGVVRRDASPKALGDLAADERQAAFAPKPTILPATDILFDAWSLTTIRDKMPGRPHVEPYLHGIAEWQPQETYIAWREEVETIIGDLVDRYPPVDLLEDYPLKPHELLHDRSDRVFKQLEILAWKHADKPVWMVDEDGGVEVSTLRELADRQRKNRIEDCTVLLPPNAGGLSGGMFDGAAEPPATGSLDVADEWYDEKELPLRTRIQSDETAPEGMRLIRSIEVSSRDDEGDSLTWDWYSRIPEGSRTASKPVLWDVHVGDVVCQARRILAGLALPPEIADAVIVAANLHDHGKRRERFQITLGNRGYPDVLWAKSDKKGARLPEPFRHEFASVLDAQAHEAFKKVDDEMKDLVVHLIAAHHGRARPHFPRGEDFDPERGTAEGEVLAIETPRRFARLQRKYGRWGLAYLESLLRAADWAASAAPSAFVDE